MTRDPLTALKTRAKQLGFADFGIVDLATYGSQPGDSLDDFITADYHGTMGWMKETADRRRHPLAMWPEAKSAITLGYNYGPDTDPMATLEHADRGTVSVYARHRDYHSLIKGKLKELAALLARDTGHDVKVFIDTAPLMEKPLAQAGGLGWQGKHTNLVSRDYGSWLFLGVILSAANLEALAPETDHCGSCRACLDICPTNAFPSAYKLDARRCISYLTIEHAGAVDIELREKMGNRIYGCDDCLAVCPWNKYARVTQDEKLLPREDLNAPKLTELAALTDVEFRKYFSGSPIKRIGHKRFLRNVLYAIGNSGLAELASIARGHGNDADPVVAEAAQWAASRLG
ncbi:tRNA epoxyqueuosine(34) reductase QueG [Robiginitomaculum antarcticum]|uniref:tRNA epoxyqueuosine(34) reductase QueG n=1 Tax=Robiginitomaculum antarcticum TaxID=437507 RepID=UPI0003743738|nr:tRNA epoxyqueuosine(34) reductase QueG [Robiginitomaculum antarcticum]